MGQAMRGLSSVILLPIYTTRLTPAEYGLVELLNMVIDLATLLIGARIGIGIFKYYSDAGTDEQKRGVISTALVSACLANLVGTLCIWLFSERVSGWLDAPEGFSSALQVLALTLALNAVNEVFFFYLRLNDRSTAYVAASLVRFLGQLVLSILFIVYLGFGYWGIILATLISASMLTLLFGFWLLPSIGMRFSRSTATNLFFYSQAIVLSSLSMYYVAVGNRYFLTLYHGLAAVGIYALAQKFGLTFLSLVWGPFATFWNTKQFEYARERNAQRLFGVIFLYVNLVLVPAALGLMLLAPHFLRVFAGADYWAAAEIVPWAVGTSLLQCWTDYCRFGILRAGRNIHFAYGTAATVVLVTVLYWQWIPSDGALGAAKATFVAFVFRLAYFAVVGRKFFTIDVPWGRFAVMLGYFLAIYAVLSSWPLLDGPALIVKPLVVVASAVVLAATPVTLRSHRNWVVTRVLRKRG